MLVVKTMETPILYFAKCVMLLSLLIFKSHFPYLSVSQYDLNIFTCILSFSSEKRL